MAFTIFQKYTLVDPDEVNDNFYHIGDGDLMPRGGLSLTVTDSVYDLGNADTRYSEIHVNDVNITGELSESWNLVGREVLSATAATLSISDLDGENSEFFHIIARAVCGSTSTQLLRMAVGDTTSNIITSSNYSQVGIMSTNDTTTVSYITGTSGFILGRNDGVTTTSVIFSDAYLYAKTGQDRMLISNSINGADGNYGGTNRFDGSILTNTTTPINAVIIWLVGRSFETGTTLEIWSRK